MRWNGLGRTNYPDWYEEISHKQQAYLEFKEENGQPIMFLHVQDVHGNIQLLREGDILTLDEEGYLKAYNSQDFLREHEEVSE